MWTVPVHRLVVSAVLGLCTAPLWAQPQITNLQPTDGSLLSSRSGTLSGRAAGATLLRVDGNELTLGGDGSFSYGFDLPEGESALLIYAEDAGGNTSLVHHLEVDTLAPSIVVSAPAQTRVGASPVEVAGTVQEPHLSGVTVRGSPASLSGNAFSAEVTLVEGHQNVAIVATDSLGHSSTVTLVLTLDTQAPTITLTESGAAFSGGLFDHPLSPQISISDAGTYTSEILLDGSSYTSGTAISSEGAHQLQISATDAVGNSRSREIDFTLDFSAPSFGQISPAAGSLIATTTVSLQVEATGATRVKVGSLEGSANGNLYTLGPISLAEGSQELLIEAFDAAGNRAERRHVLLRDTTAPTLQILSPANGAVLTSSPVTISGQANDPRLTSVRVGGDLAALSGSSFSISKELSEGSNSFSVEALDSAGNSTTQNLGITLDTTAPSFTVKVGGVALAGGEVFSAAITPTIELSETSATVTATLDGASFTFGSAISADGNHQLSVTVSHNGLSSSNLFAFRIDRQPPVFDSLLPADGSILAATSVVLEGHVQHAVSLEVDGVAVALQGEVFTAGPYSLSAGASRTFVLLATSEGGITTEKRLTVVQDGTPPQLTIGQPAENGLLGSATVSVSGTVSDPHLLRVRVSGVDAQVSGSSYLAAGVSLAEGNNTLTVVAEDRAGNTRQLSRTVVRDATDPELTITDPVAGTVVPAASYTVRGTATDTHLDRVEVNGRRATVAGSAWSLAVTLTEGANSIEVVAIDRLGHRKTATVSLQRDSAAPQVTIQDPAENFATQAASVTVRGAYELEAGTTVKVNGLVAVLTNGHFEVAAVPLSPGENRITARAVDAQGNEGVHTRTVIRDQVAPSFVGIEPASGALALPLTTVFRLTFSEEMAAPAEGAITLATAAGAPLAFSVAVSGNDLVVTPAALLPPQTALRLTLTAALTDRAGNHLAPVPAAFELTTVDTGAPGAPVVSPTPAAAACRHQVELQGTAEALAQVRAVGGAAAALTRADEAGAFTLTVELLPEQLNVLHLTAIDALGNVSPERVLELAADCTAPQVTDAVLSGSTVTVTFSKPVTAAATAFNLTTPSGVETFGFALNGATATLTLGSAPSSLLELSVGEGATTGVNDLAGNALAFPWRRLFGTGSGDSFIAGTTFDDGKGQPLEGVLVSVTATGGVPLADPLPQQTTAADGRFLLGLPAGTHDVTFARPGYAPVFRVVTTAAGEGTHVFDPRLTLLNLPVSIGSSGGEVASEGARLVVPAGALASSQATSLTVLSEQALPALLPYGFSPRGAAYLAIDASFASPATLTLPIDTAVGRQVVIASLDFGLLQWKAVELRTVNGPSLSFEISQPGAYVAVEADPEAAAQLVAVPGQVLPSLPAPSGEEITAATVAFAPTLVLPSQRSRATVSYTLESAGTPAPSGMPLTLGVQERLTLVGGGERRAVPYSADLLVFRAPAGGPRSRFWLQPSSLAASLPIELGAEDVTVRTFGETSVRGNILGPDGGSVLGAQGDVFEVPAGALTRPTAVVVKRRTVADLSHAAPAGFPVLGVIEVDLGGASLASSGRLTLATENPPAAGARGLLLGSEEIDGELRWRALAELEPVAAGWRTVATGGSNPPWPGVRKGGFYLALELEGDWGLLEGVLYDADQDEVAGGLISSPAVPWIQLSNSNGSYVIPLPAGSAVVVSARDTRQDQVAVEIPAFTAGERRVFDLEVLPTGPTVVEIEPADGAANVPTSFLPRVRFSEPIDRSTLATGIRLKRDGDIVPIDIDHQNDRVVIDPASPLLPDTSYILEIGTNIADLQGRHLVASQSVSFRTQVVEGPTPGIDASKVLLYEPDHQGLAKIVGLPGAVPANSTLWVEAVASVTVVSGSNGSFELEIPATLGDDLFLTVLVPSQSAASRLLGPWLLRGDLGAWVDKRGGRFKTAAGVELEVQRDSFEELTRVALRVEAPPIATPSQLQVLVNFNLDLGGQESQKPIFLRLAAPVGAPAGTTYLVSRFVEALGRRGWMAMDLLERQGNSLTNASLTTVPGSVVARAASVEASRFENPLDRVLSSEDMADLRQGNYLPKASKSMPREEAQLVPRGGLESIAQKTAAQDLGLPGIRTGGVYQVASTVVELAWAALNRGVTDLMVFVLSGEAADFLAVTAHAGPRWLLVPILKKLFPFEIAVFDLTTGYQIYRQVQPPTPDPIFNLPPGDYADNQPPSIIDGTPLRFALVQTAAEGELELLRGITAKVHDNSLFIEGQLGSTAPGAEVLLFDIDAPAATDPSQPSQIKDAKVRASDGGSFTIAPPGMRPGQRFLLAIGGVVGPSDRLTLRFSEIVKSVDGIHLHPIDENGKVSKSPIQVSTSSLDRGATWQISPSMGWRAGKYQLRVTTSFGDSNPDEEHGNKWKRELKLEFSVPKASSAGNIALGRFADFDRFGNLLAVADNENGLKLFDVSNPADPKPFTTSETPYRFAGGGAIRGVAVENHGRIVVVGGGELNPGQLHVLDPLAVDREAPAQTAWTPEHGIWGFTSITNPLGVSYPFAKSGLPRRIAVMNNDLVVRWQVGESAPAGIVVTAAAIGDSGEKELTLTGLSGAIEGPVTLRNVTRGRWNRVFSDLLSTFSIKIKATPGDVLELRRGRGTWAYVSIDGRGIAMVDVEGAGGGVTDVAASLALVEYTNGYHLDSLQCDDSRPDVSPTPIDLDVLLAESDEGVDSATLVTLVQGYGLALYQIDPEHPGSLTELSSACAAVDHRVVVSGMELVRQYPMDLDQNGRIRERAETSPEGQVLEKELRDYVVVAHSAGNVLIFDISDAAKPKLVSRVKIGKADEVVQISGVTVDRVHRKIYVGAFGRGLFAVDFNVLGGQTLSDVDEDGLDDRVTERIEVGDEELVDALAFPELGVIWAGGRKHGAASVAIGSPKLQAVAADGGPIREVSRMAPLGVPTAHEGGKLNHPKFPAAFQVQAVAPGTAPEMKVDVRSLGPTGFATKSLGDQPKLPKTSFSGDDALKLTRQAENPWEEGSTLYLSERVVTLADVRASIAYERDDKEDEDCHRCDQIEEHLYEGPPTDPSKYLPELLSGFQIAIDWKKEIKPSLVAIYGPLLGDGVRVKSVPWEMSPSPEQEPILNPSTGMGEVVPGTLLHSGEFTQQVTDASLTAAGFSLAFIRTYRSQTIGSGVLGPGWYHNYEAHLRELPNGDIEYYDGTGRRDLILTRDTSLMSRVRGLFSVDQNTQGWNLTDDKGIKWRFDRFGRLQSMVDPLKNGEDQRGNELLLEYDAASNLASVSSSGQSFQFTYDEGKLVSLSDSAQRKWEFRYDDEGRLEQVAVPDVELSAGNQQRLTDGYTYSVAPSESLTRYLAKRDDIQEFEDSLGKNWLTLEYQDVPESQRTRLQSEKWGSETPAIGFAYEDGKTTVTDRRSKTHVYQHDEYGNLLTYTDPDSNVFHWKMANFEAGKRAGLVAEVKAPLGQKTVVEYVEESSPAPNPRNLLNIARIIEHPELMPIGPPIPPDCQIPVQEEAGPVIKANFAGHHPLFNAPASATTAGGKETHQEQSEEGLVQSITVNNGGTTTPLEIEALDHNKFGLPEQIVTHRGDGGPPVVENRRYDPESGRLEKVSVSGRETKIDYDSAGRIRRQEETGGIVETFEYNDLGWLLKECKNSTPARSCTEYEYNSNGWIKKVKLPFGTGEGTFTTVRFEYGELGEVLEVYREVKPGGPELKETRKYDHDLNLLEVDPPGEAKTVYTYNNRGLVETETLAAGTPLELVTTFTYDAVGRVKTMDQGGRQWQYVYDQFGRQTRTIDPLNTSQFTLYDISGNATEQISCGSNGKVLSRISHDYDAGGRPVKETIYAISPDPNTPTATLDTSFVYDGAAKLKGVWDSDGVWTTFKYDELGRVRWQQVGEEAEELVTQHFYDDAARRVSTQQKVGEIYVLTTEKFNTLGLLESLTDSQGKTTRFEYDLRGNLIRQTLPDGQFTEYEYDGLDRPVRMTEAENVEVKVEYQDGADQSVVLYTDSLNQTTTFNYNSSGLLQSITYPDGTTETNVYDKFGNPVTQLGPGQTYENQFDALSRLTSRTRVSGDGPAVEQTFQWDGIGRLKLASAAGHTTAWTWDTASRNLKETQGSFAVTYGRSASGLPTSVHYPSDLVVGRTFDSGKRISGISSSLGEATFGFVGDGLVSMSVGPLTGSQSYDTRGLLEYRTFEASGKQVFGEHRLYQPSGLLESIERSDIRSRKSFTYDSAGRLKVAQRDGIATSVPGRFEFDADSAHNLTAMRRISACGTEATALPVDASKRNRPASVDGNELEWDSRGRLVRKKGLSFVYDDQDRLIQVADGAEGTNELASYEYDVMNRRVERQVGESHFRMVWDGWQPIEEYLGGSLHSRRIYGEGADEVLQLQLPQASGELRSFYPIYDAIGNVALLVGDDGHLVERYEYGPFGERWIFVDDHQAPEVEQARVENGAIWLQLTEGSVKQPEISQIRLINLTRPETPVLRLRTVSFPGRQFGRQLVLENGGNPADEPPTWPSPGDHVSFEVLAGAFEDSFQNASSQFWLEDVVWPETNGLLGDTASPQVEEICVQGDVLKVSFSEKVKAELANLALLVDGEPVEWLEESGGYTLRVSLPSGSHELTSSTGPLDISGLGLGQTVAQEFTVNNSVHQVYAEPYGEEAGSSAAGNVLGFKGLPEDQETGFLYVRNRYYDPEIGRFITPDPTGYQDGPNTYQFALNDPINFSDPSGLSLQASDLGGVGFAMGSDFVSGVYGMGDLASGGAFSGIRAGFDALQEATSSGYGPVDSVLYAIRQADRQSKAVQTLGLSEAEDPIGHAQNIGRGFLDSLTGRDQYLAGKDAFAHGENVEGYLRWFSAGATALSTVFAPVTELKALRGASAAAKIARAEEIAKVAEAGSAAKAVRSSGRVAAMRARMANVKAATSRAVKVVRRTCNCFTAGTPIATLEGEKPIEEIEVGDQVWARNPDTGEVELAAVLSLFHREAEGTLRIHLSEESEKGELEVTPDHPIFVAGRGWVEAGSLAIGDELVGLADAEVRIEGIDWEPGAVRVYNFEVEGVHNYFAGPVEVLVHNAKGCNTTRLGVKRRNASDWRKVRGLWDETGYGHLLSPRNRERIAKGKTPIVDDEWIAGFPEDRGLKGELISIHHIGGTPITIPLPHTRHVAAHTPGGYRNNPGGPGSAVPSHK